MLVGIAPGGDVEEALLDGLGDGPARARAHRDAIHRADRRDFGRGAGKEELIRQIQHLAGHGHLFHFVAQIMSDGPDSVAGDAAEDGGGQWRRIHHASHDHEQVLARAFGHIAVNIQADSLVIAQIMGFHGDELAVDVLAADLAQRRSHARGRASPGADQHIHALIDGFFAQIRAPGHGADDDLGRAFAAIHAQGFVTAINQRADVAGILFVGPNGGLGCLNHFLHGVSNGNAHDFCRVFQPPEMFVAAEDGRAFGRVVGANAFENAGAIM